MKVCVEEVEAGVKQSKTREHLVVKIRARVFEEGQGVAVEKSSEVTLEKDASFFKITDGMIYGYVIIRGDTEKEREADYARTATVLKTLGIEGWSVSKEGGKLKKIRLTGGALDTLMRIEPVCAAMGICQKPK
ncbi:hypothetical protein [Pyrobaculum ferrireducens]|uniref:Uncharacterized protein n=1 Tax=Pyrobaculum ferrireducens TaxID=1104324 RepID=G7VF77_9CREN|nr:hypothetical protein [Pyrobaculum ferrireducens]AET31693.1 hypothetical protein P186_0232 [Pyrobaculum ferrireducens]